MDTREIDARVAGEVMGSSANELAHTRKLMFEAEYMFGPPSTQPVFSEDTTNYCLAALESAAIK